jgi:hypothetical protein
MKLNDDPSDKYLKYWYGEQLDDGLWYLHNTNKPRSAVGPRGPPPQPHLLK